MGLLEQLKDELQQVNKKISDLYAVDTDSVEAKYLVDTARYALEKRINEIQAKVGSLKVDIQNAETVLSNCTSFREKYKKEYENNLAMIEREEENAKWQIEQKKIELLEYEEGE